MNQIATACRRVLRPALFILLLLHISVFLHAQNVQRTITGVVRDETNSFVVGATIQVESTGRKAVANNDGAFSIVIPTGKQTLIITSINHDELKIVVAENQTVIDARLQSKVTALEDVVIVAYGTQKKESVVGAIGQIKGEQLKKTGGVSTVSEALQGQLPGLTAVNSNGKPGSDAAALFIRGISSFNNTSPFVLVDGVERNLNQIDPNEIDKISVLKDASATAVYGTRGANGVILITTKRGRIGKPEFSFSANFGFKTPTIKPEYSDYITAMELYNEAAINDKLYANLIPESTINAWRQNIGNAGPYNQYFPQVDWWNEAVRDYGSQKNYNLSARGGSQFMRYFVSFGYLDDGDIYKTTANEDFDPQFRVQRYNWRTNFDFDITKSTVFSINFSGNFRYRNQPGYRIDGGGEDGFGQDQFFNRIYSAPRNAFPLRYEDGTIGESVAGENNMLLNLNEGGQRVYKYFQGFYDAQLTQDLDFITPGLSVRGKISYTSGSTYQISTLRSGVTGNFSALNVIRYNRTYDYANPVLAPDGKTIIYPMSSEIRYPNDQSQEQPLISSGDAFLNYEKDLYYEASINYARKFKKHDVGALVLFNRRELIDAGAGAAINIGEYGEDYVGRITYGYKSRYLAEVNASYTGSSKFSSDKAFGFFPSAAVGWVISSEPIFKKILGDNIINTLKARYNWGVVGSDRGVPANQFIQTYSTGGAIRFGDQNLNSFGPLYYEGQTANVNNTWEKATKQNLGIDASMFRSRLRGSVDFFKEDRKDILMERLTIPRAFGNSAPFANLGVTKNHGYEIELGWNDKLGKEFNYYVNVNYSWSENRIVFRDDARLTAEYLKQANKQIGFQTRYLNAGYYSSLDDIYNYPTPVISGSPALRIPGDFIYADFNGDGIVDQFDRVPMRYTSTPMKTLGVNAGFSYKSWAVNFLLYAAGDVYREIPDLFLWDFNSGFVVGQSNIAQRWTVQTASTAVKPALHISNNGHNNQGSTYSYVDAAYIRLKNAEVSYTVNWGLLKRSGFKSLLLYVNGNNLFTLSKLDSRIDPETSGANVYPIVRRFNFGLRTNF
ncbi:MAG TPA: TonB-dependent receptor [Lacibacter sp.]|nr:TonB-dependent receptor [Lacibacter sp.]